MGNPLIEIGLPISLFIIMIGIGLTLTMAEFEHEVKQPRGVVVGSLGTLLILPVLSFGVAWLMNLPEAIAVGIVIAAACPGGATSNVVAYMARGNVALSIILTAVASLATILTLPLFVAWALEWQYGAASSVRMPVLDTVLLLTVVVVIPVAIGMFVRGRAPALAQRLEKPLNLFGLLVLAVLIVFISWSVRDRITTLVTQAGIACIVLNIVGIATGWLLARVAGLNLRDRVTISVELGLKNMTIGILVATTVLKSAEMAMVPMLYGLLMYGFAAGLISYGRKKLPTRAPEVAPT